MGVVAVGWVGGWVGGWKYGHMGIADREPAGVLAFLGWLEAEWQATLARARDAL